MTTLESSIQLYDHEIIAIDKGPVRWMTQRQGTAMNLEEFRNAVVGKFQEIGLTAKVLSYETSEAGTFAFDVEITGRTHSVGEFDFDRMVHEVTNNILDEPGVEKGFINTAQSAAEFRHANPDAHKGHGPGCVK